jgi:hypothetical protein
MSLVLPDGYVLDTIGPFRGTMNDASITEHITRSCQSLVSWCADGDAMVVDRGFRDVIDTLSNLGYEPKMPVFLRKGEKQHTTEDANKSRLVTRVRWTVESYHARIKKWRFLGERVENSFVPKVKDCIRIVSAALNCYRGAIIANAASDHSELLARQMKRRVSLQNSLLVRVENGSLSGRSRWKKKIEDADFDFPEISLDDMRALFFGSYQIKQARTYVEEHLDPDGDYTIELGDTDEDILRCTIQSRHSNAAKYKAWIQFSLTGDPIIAWYCQCKGGARTVGSCAHVASVIWYLAYARHNDFTSSTGRRRLQQAIVEAEASSGDENDF